MEVLKKVWLKIKMGELETIALDKSNKMQKHKTDQYWTNKLEHNINGG